MGFSACALWLALAAPAAGKAAPPTLQQAIPLFDNFADAAAEDAFRAILAAKPRRETAARAHLYLGLVAVNQLKIDQALDEFRAALLSDATLDLIRGASPKARLAFAEARRDLEGQLATPVPPPEAPAPASTPPVDVPWTEAQEPPPSHSHALGITLLAIGAACAGTAIYGGVDLLEYQSQVSTANQSPRTVTFDPAVASSRGQANFWAAAWIPFAVVGAAGVAAGIFIW